MKAGDIVHIFAENTTPPKNKFIIILGVSEEKVKYLNVFINSEINTNVYRSPIQQALCIPIKQKDYSFFLKKIVLLTLTTHKKLIKPK